ncbi:MAG: hypothetical protein ACI4BI_02930 [Anaerotardibacter sp.]
MYQPARNALFLFFVFFVCLACFSAFSTFESSFLKEAGEEIFFESEEETKLNKVAINNLISDEEVSFLNQESFLGNDLPDSFQEEVGVISSAEEVYRFKNGNLVGVVSSQNASQSLLSYSKMLEEKGWIQVESGWDNLASFVKNQGSFHWLVVQSADYEQGSLLTLSY